MPFEIPEDLAALSDEQIQELLDKALDAFKELGLSEDSDEETIAQGEELATLIKDVRATSKQRAEATQARKDRAKNLLEEMRRPGPGDPPGGPEDPDGPEEPEEPAPVVAEKKEVEPVAASSSPVKRAAAKAPEIKTPSRRVVITASADVPGYSNGQELDSLTAAGMALVSRMRGMPDRNVGDIQHRYGAAVIRKEGFGDLHQDHYRDDSALIAAAGNEKRLPGGSLTAAGGWCAPSETLYDICDTTTIEGILSIPEFQVNRGGIRYMPHPDFSVVYSGCGFTQTEAQAIAGTAKTCCSPTCPSFTEIRLGAIGICVTAPLLTNAAYPEYIRQFVEEAMAAHAHRVNAYIIGVMVAAAGTAVTTPYLNQGALSLTLNALEWQAAALRQKWRLGVNSTIEVVAPQWLRNMLRIDISARAGLDFRTLTDAEIDSWFTNRNLAPQYVYDWQDLTFTGDAPSIPANVSVLMYPAGTWAKGTTDVINLDAVYDSAGLVANTFTAVFVEEGILAVQRCTETNLVTLPVCASGRTGAANLTQCFPAVVAP